MRKVILFVAALALLVAACTSAPTTDEGEPTPEPAAPANEAAQPIPAARPTQVPVEEPPTPTETPELVTGDTSIAQEPEAETAVVTSDAPDAPAPPAAPPQDTGVPVLTEPAAAPSSVTVVCVEVDGGACNGDPGGPITINLPVGTTSASVTLTATADPWSNFWWWTTRGAIESDSAGQTSTKTFTLTLDSPPATVYAVTARAWYTGGSTSDTIQILLNQVSS